MNIVFQTNIDCCKRFVDNLNARHPEWMPCVGDYVEVYEAKDTSILLQAVSRTWRCGQLHIELGLTPFWKSLSLLEFEKWVKEPPILNKTSK